MIKTASVAYCPLSKDKTCCAPNRPMNGTPDPAPGLVGQEPGCGDPNENEEDDELADDNRELIEAGDAIPRRQWHENGDQRE
jgi:hypothetical protein